MAVRANVYENNLPSYSSYLVCARIWYVAMHLLHMKNGNYNFKYRLLMRWIAFRKLVAKSRNGVWVCAYAYKWQYKSPIPHFTARRVCVCFIRSFLSVAIESYFIQKANCTNWSNALGSVLVLSLTSPIGIKYSSWWFLFLRFYVYVDMSWWNISILCTRNNDILNLITFRCHSNRMNDIRSIVTSLI